MKKINFKIAVLLLAFIGVYSCDEADPELLTVSTFSFDPSGESVSLSVPVENTTLEIPVIASSLSSADRSVPVEIVSVSDNSNTGEYSVGTVTIPAGEYFGSLSVDFTYAAIDGMDGDVKNITISILDGPGYDVYRNTTSIDYFREIICNDLELEIMSDIWANETYWRIEQVNADGSTTDLTGAIFPFATPSCTPQNASYTFTLPDGDYTYAMGDTFGDGMEGSAGCPVSPQFGTYSLTCSIIVHAQGEGAFTGAIPDPTVAGNAPIVEVTPFSVNP